VQNLTPVVADREKAIQNTKSERWDCKEVHGSNCLAMIPEERQPFGRRLRRWTSLQSQRLRSVCCCFFVISYDRRRILHFNVTNHPTSLWTVQQLREGFPFESAPRFLIFDRDAKYGLEVVAADTAASLGR